MATKINAVENCRIQGDLDMSVTSLSEMGGQGGRNINTLRDAEFGGNVKMHVGTQHSSNPPKHKKSAWEQLPIVNAIIQIWRALYSLL